MKKIVSIIVSALIGLVALVDGLWFFNQKTTATTASTTAASSPTTATSNSNTTSAALASSSSSASTGYKDGTYTGSTVSTQWGNVEVKVTISSGKISAITFLKSTSDDGNSKSTAIDDTAEPQYISEAKAANSATIQAISGATVTYNGFTSSLQNALNQAL
ncbi:MAG: FMN-binding protein [Streptococcaceae bacterium]|jgi:uncharacterized protein with FMN-binding domain|nr:FMN-binding protein [Streptococcaceae bacterium]